MSGAAGEAGAAGAALSSDATPHPPPSAHGHPPPTEWEEEREALSAIYGEGQLTLHSPSWTSLAVAVELSEEVVAAAQVWSDSLLDAAELAEAAAAGEAGEAGPVGYDAATRTLTMHLDFLAPEPPGAYPHQGPTLGVRCRGVSSAALLTLTRRLAEHAQRLRGQPLVFELAQQAAEMVPGCLEAPWPVQRVLAGGEEEGLAPEEEAEEEGEGEVDGELAERAQRALALSGGGERRGRGQAPSVDTRAESARLAEALARLQGDARHAGMRTARARLPAAAQRGEVVELVAKRRVVVVSGATGCGKSTQVGRGEGGGRWGMVALDGVLKCKAVSGSL
jgi:hypothetical protein